MEGHGRALMMMRCWHDLQDAEKERDEFRGKFLCVVDRRNLIAAKLVEAEKERDETRAERGEQVDILQQREDECIVAVGSLGVLGPELPAKIASLRARAEKLEGERDDLIAAIDHHLGIPAWACVCNVPEPGTGDQQQCQACDERGAFIAARQQEIVTE